jgi:hypothetical protein
VSSLKSHCSTEVEFTHYVVSYGGIYERGSREYTLDDFYSLPLDKMDRYTCLKKSDVVIPEGDVESSSDEDGEDDSNEDEEEDSDADDESDGAETLVDEDVRELEKGAAIYDTINALKKAILEEEEEAELDDVSLVPDINTEEEQVNWPYMIWIFSFVDQKCRMIYVNRQMPLWVLRKIPLVRRRMFKALHCLEKHWLCSMLALVSWIINSLLLLLLMYDSILRRVLDSKGSREQR